MTIVLPTEARAGSEHTCRGDLHASPHEDHVLTSPCARFLGGSQTLLAPRESLPREEPACGPGLAVRTDGWLGSQPGNSQSLRGRTETVTLQRPRRAACGPQPAVVPRPAWASRGRESREQVEVAAQGATVLRHLLAAVELCARGVAFALLDKAVHLDEHVGHVHVTSPL